MPPDSAASHNVVSSEVDVLPYLQAQVAGLVHREFRLLLADGARLRATVKTAKQLMVNFISDHFALKYIESAESK